MLNYEQIEVDYEIPSIEKELTQVQLVRYAGASGDFNPIHTVPAFAKSAGLDGTIGHGMLSMGMMGELVSSFAGIKAVRKYSVSFKSMARPGDVLIVKGVVKKKYEKDGVKLVDLKVSIEDQEGDIKADGKATIAFD